MHIPNHPLNIKRNQKPRKQSITILQNSRFRRHSARAPGAICFCYQLASQKRDTILTGFAPLYNKLSYYKANNPESRGNSSITEMRPETKILSQIRIQIQFIPPVMHNFFYKSKNIMAGNN